MKKEAFIDKYGKTYGIHWTDMAFIDRRETEFLKALGSVIEQAKDEERQEERNGFVRIVEAERQNTILSINDVRTMWINQMCDRLTKTIRKLK